jgi:hypothetical protein
MSGGHVCEFSFKLSPISLDDVITGGLAQAWVPCLKTLERISSNPWALRVVKPF